MARAEKSKAPEKENLAEYRRKRDFSKTAEPAGEGRGKGTGLLRFVIQKHAASHLHYDLRLEMDGVMRSWAVPKGPSLNPKARRLAMEVEDHPIEYNTFEGTIPKGEYGGGTVMLWDHGHYVPKDAKKKEDSETAALRGYEEGRLGITFLGERLKGSYNLVRTERTEDGPKSKWLFFKISDEHASTGVDITESVTTSVTTGRTMDEIARGKDGKRVWHSNRDGDAAGEEGSTPGALPDLSALEPMLATSTDIIPVGQSWIFEPKYDGIRVLALASSGGVALITRNGHDKSRQFPEVVEALRELVASSGSSMVLDGEIVALTEDGSPGRFERLQSRMHLTGTRRIEQLRSREPACFVAFDILVAGNEVLISKEWDGRRRRLEEMLEDHLDDVLRISEVEADARKLVDRAKERGWEGIMAKVRSSPYRPGQRSRSWLKHKLESQQEFVVAGWTEPRKSRAHFGALLLGYYDGGELVYAGHTGTGFSGAALADMAKRLKPLERKTSPFTTTPATNEPAHWVSPKIVVQVKFNEWTSDGKLRHPVYLGIREDKEARDVVREQEEVIEPAFAEAETTGAPEGPPPPPDELIARIRELEGAGRNGSLPMGEGQKLAVTSLRKKFYPETGHTKGDLLTYYATVGPWIVPWMKDRPLVLKRFPNGVDGESFYQQAAPDSPPAGVRVENVVFEGKEQRRLVGENLTTLLYTIQLGAISYDPWHSRVGNLASADYTILDLDPGPGATFSTVIDVARVVKEEMDQLGVHGALKTSGSRGLHIYLPLPPNTPLEAATLISQIIATRTARRVPEIATVERMTKNRPEGTIYVDYLQNILGKTIAGVYAVRAKPEPTVSTPLSWDELRDDLDLKAFTVDTVPERLAKVGDLWTDPMSKPISIDNLLRAHGR